MTATVADWHHFVVVVEVAPGVLPPITKGLELPLLVGVLLLVVPALVPAVPPVPGLGGLAVVPDEVEPVLPAARSGVLQALSESAATTASVAIATCERDVFIRKLLEDCLKFASGAGLP